MCLLTKQVPLNYQDLYNQASIRPERSIDVRKLVEDIYKFKPVYDQVSLESGIPWWCVGAIHSLEAGLSFNRHLHNGDPLTNRTVHVPNGRPLAMPKSGNFPYEWYESASDALSLHSHPLVMDPIPECLQYMEAYNGFGYRKKNIYTPYLWGATSLYTSGLYVSDGSFNPTVASAQIGGAAILKELENQKLIALPVITAHTE